MDLSLLYDDCTVWWYLICAVCGGAFVYITVYIYTCTYTYTYPYSYTTSYPGIPETEYKCTVRLPSSEFQRIIRDISSFGDTCTISVTKEGIRFSASGDVCNGNIMLKKNTSVDKDEDAVGE
ncbi:hypothetical protein EON64_10400 [archaeon]|nr:MAG: hypothetical protein EON64_10400 [archaeon]